MPRLRLPFVLRGHKGIVHVTCGVNRDPKKWGYQHLDLPFDGVAASQGFPTVSATVSYQGRGYDSIVGWIQLVQANADPPDKRDMYLLDLPPMFGDLDIPFGWFGPGAGMFDAPSTTQTKGSYRWVANAFLCTSAGILMKPVVSAVLGFGWGYELRGNRRPRLMSPWELSEKDWNGHLRFLRKRCPRWRFRPGFRHRAGT